MDGTRQYEEACLPRILCHGTCKSVLENLLAEGVKFYHAPNEIWLSDDIPPQYMSLFKN